MGLIPVTAFFVCLLTNTSAAGWNCGRVCPLCSEVSDVFRDPSSAGHTTCSCATGGSYLLLILDTEVFDKITHVRRLDIQATAEDMIRRVHRRVFCVSGRRAVLRLSLIIIQGVTHAVNSENIDIFIKLPSTIRTTFPRLLMGYYTFSLCTLRHPFGFPHISAIMASAEKCHGIGS